jgi:hypothetical protein
MSATADDLLALARRDGVQMYRTRDRTIRMVGPETVVGELARAIRDADLKESILERLPIAPHDVTPPASHLSHLSRSVPPDRDAKTPYKSTPVPPVPPVPPISGIPPRVPNGPEDRSELRIYPKCINNEERGLVEHPSQTNRETDRVREWEILTADGLFSSTFTPPISEADLRALYPTAIDIRPAQDPPPALALDAETEAQALAYLEAIGETDPELRADYLAHLGRAPHLVDQMRAALAAMGPQTGPPTARNSIRGVSENFP